MTLSEKQYQQTLGIIEALNSCLDDRQLRQRAGERILQSLRADFFCSYRWSVSEQRFEHCVAINMDPANLQRYEQHFWQCDPITCQLQQYKRAVAVEEVMPQKALEKTEFFQDFLQKDGLHHGVNLYIYEGEHNVADFRIWRRKGSKAFDRDELMMLDLIAPHFRNAIRNACQPDVGLNDLRKRHPDITAREADVAMQLLKGQNDKAIAAVLNISYATVRSHINQLYNKTGIHGRTAFLHYLQQKQ
jgi:DNA-binding CsgD family transcriptional regulator